MILTDQHMRLLGEIAAAGQIVCVAEGQIGLARDLVEVGYLTRTKTSSYFHVATIEGRKAYQTWTCSLDSHSPDAILRKTLADQHALNTALKLENRALKEERAALVETIQALETQHARDMALAGTETHLVALQLEVQQWRERVAARDQRIEELLARVADHG
jgi:hypothetical protein